MAADHHLANDEQTLKQVRSLARASAEAPKVAGGALAPAFDQYLEQLVCFATGEDRYWRDPAGLLQRALGSWAATAVRKGRAPVAQLGVREHADWRETRLVIEIATDDMPFIVDSVSAALVEAGKQVSFFVNAVIPVARDAAGRRIEEGGPNAKPESMIHVEMDPPVDASEIARLETEVKQVLADVRLAVEDYAPMRECMAQAIAGIENAPAKDIDDETRAESAQFLRELWERKFTFLGARRFRFESKAGVPRFERVDGSDLGILRDGDRRVLKTTYSKLGELSPSVVEFLASSEPLVVSKANGRSTVHRRVHMDYVGVKTYDAEGRVTGEQRFTGLFTSEFSTRRTSDIPILRVKERKVLEGTSFRPGGHNEKALRHILETFPREELFQSDVKTLLDTSLSILRLYKRPRAKLFLRRDRFDRFVSALVYFPRDKYSSDTREKVGELLEKAYHGKIVVSNPQIGEPTLTRVHYIISIDPGTPEGPSLAELTRQIRDLTRGWADGLLEAMRTQHKGATPLGLFQRWESAFDAGYRERVDAAEALADIAAIEGLGAARRTQRVFRRAGDASHEIHIKLYCRGQGLRLSDLVPCIEHLGLSVIQDAGYAVEPETADHAAKSSDSSAPPETFWIHDFQAVDRRGNPIDAPDVEGRLADTLGAVLDGRTEDDGFNGLVIGAGIDWREAWYLRAVAKYLQQACLPFSQGYVEETFARHPKIARALIDVLNTRFDPAGSFDRGARAEERAEAQAVAVAAVAALLKDVESLDEDRILRRHLNVVQASSRTNFYQRDSDGNHYPYISFKIISKEVDELPEPRPYREIFMSGPRVDGVHLRFGAVARGGLRLSDRKEDFRTEVLALVKAQRVKNAVIVPTGSKGGFVPKQLPQGGDRDAVFAEGREAYKLFVRSLLELTDNIVSGETVPPASVVCWDEPDPYLVVAADKGTATFSDTANGISAEYGFWLGDAFASGGSKGYDHKVMAITARGGWEAVKRHFRELGKDIQKEAFTVAGVGDMSGDVFGNGMLLSPEIRLVAAFDHRHIFLDPKPDAAMSFLERERLFKLPRSSWDDFDRKRISKGGGVFERKAKAIPLSKEIQALLELRQAEATPREVMRAVLKLRVDLFWLGGIGTYFKAPNEDDLRVSDRQNDSIRITSDEMRMAVLGEGANLGITQAGRIAFALKGGRLNTDAIDNSAGVDSSDHEVNIKILLSGAIESGELRAEQRNDLLKRMTEDVARHVLAHNYDQTRALSLMEATAVRELGAYGRLMDNLEAEGRLDRVVEGLPDARGITARRAQGAGLTRPELAVLLAYAKMHVYELLLDADAARDDAALERELLAYFPEATHGFQGALAGHRLKREIIATRMSNEIVDACGATFVHGLMEASGASVVDVVHTYEAARRILQLRDFGQRVDALDNQVPAEVQIQLYATAVKLLKGQVNKFLRDAEASRLLSERGIRGLVDQYREPVQKLMLDLPEILPTAASRALTERVQEWKGRGAPETLAESAAHMAAFEFAFDIVNLSRQTGWSTAAIGGLFFAVGDAFQIEAARTVAKAATYDGHYDQLAGRRLVEDLTLRQVALTKSLVAFAGEEPKGAPREWLDGLAARWRAANVTAAERYERFVVDLDIALGMTVGKLSLLNTKLIELIERTTTR